MKSTPRARRDALTSVLENAHAKLDQLCMSPSSFTPTKFHVSHSHVFQVWVFSVSLPQHSQECAVLPCTVTPTWIASSAAQNSRFTTGCACSYPPNIHLPRLPPCCTVLGASRGSPAWFRHTSWRHDSTPVSLAVNKKALTDSDSYFLSGPGQLLPHSTDISLVQLLCWIQTRSAFYSNSQIPATFTFALTDKSSHHSNPQEAAPKMDPFHTGFSFNLPRCPLILWISVFNYRSWTRFISYLLVHFAQVCLFFLCLRKESAILGSTAL